MLPLGAVLVALALWLYAPLLTSAPVIDDGAVALENPAVCGNDFSPVAPFYAGTFRPLWRPFASWTLRLNCQLGGGEKGAFTLVNLILLAATALLAARLLQRLGVSMALSACTALILLMHPAQSESVLRIAGRSELLALPLLLGALLLYTSRGAPEGIRRAAPIWGLWALLYLLGLLSRESVLLLPLLLVGYELTIGSGQRIRRLTWGIGICVGLGVLWFAARAGVLRGWPGELTGNPAPDYLAALTATERVQHALALPVLYVRMLFDPAAILPDYAHLLALPPEAPPVVLGDPQSYGVSVPGIDAVLQGLVILAAGFALFFLARRRAPLAAFGGWLFGLSLLTALPLLGSNGHVASARPLFLPLLGLLMILIDLARHLLGPGVAARPTLRWGFAALGLLLLMGLFLGTRQTAAAWRSGETVIARLDERAPLSPEVPLQRAAAALRDGQRLRARGAQEAANVEFELAASLYEEAIGLFPRMPRALLNLGLLRAQQQQASMAGRALSDAAVVAQRIFPNSRLAARCYFLLGEYYGRQGLDELAMRAFQRSAAIDSTNAGALGRAGMLEAMLAGSAREGIAHMERALELDPEGRSLGPLAERVREVLRRARNYLALSEEDSVAYSEAMSGEGAPVETPDRSHRE
ncbi:MAG: hypothetical protein GF330_00090 [Candidatus Eisenbacteria bacterium]|nr:hypothetical protein [Candidatus Eisenbacteria bacterium]